MGECFLHTSATEPIDLFGNPVVFSTIRGSINISTLSDGMYFCAGPCNSNDTSYSPYLIVNGITYSSRNNDGPWNYNYKWSNPGYMAYILFSIKSTVCTIYNQRNIYPPNLSTVFYEGDSSSVVIGGNSGAYGNGDLAPLIVKCIGA